MVISVHAKSFRKTSGKSSFTGTHFTNENDEISWSYKASYCTGDCMRVTEIRSTKLDHE
jgi:hypothetical protein